MLEEFRRVRQERGSYRRLFTDEYADLYFWYTRRWGRLVGFQLCYDREGETRVLTWTEREGYRHEALDDGDVSSGGPKRTPLLVPDGAFDGEAVSAAFLARARRMPARLRALVHRKLLEFVRIEIRRATPADAADVAALDAEFNGVRVSRDHVAAALASGGEIVLLARDGAEAAGFACGQVTRSCCYEEPAGEVTELYVRPAHRRRGVGAALLAAVEREMVSQGAKELKVLTGTLNRPARRLYASAGYARMRWAAFEKRL